MKKRLVIGLSAFLVPWIFVISLLASGYVGATTIKQTSQPLITQKIVHQTTVPSLSKKEVTVYITDTGKKYHRAGCRYLRQSKHAIGLSKAKASGYTPCKVCRPPR